MAEVLSEHGYATGAFGKVHTELEGAWQGFDRVLDRLRWLRRMRKLGYWHPSDGVWWISQTFETGVNLLPDSLQFDPLVTDNALVFMDRFTDTPWFTYISYKGPHPPWVPTPEGWEGVQTGDALSPLPNDDVWTRKPHFQQQKFQDLHFDELTQRDSELHHLAFAAHTEMVDREIGRLVEYLTTRGLLDETIVVLTADHGDMAGALGIFNKTFGPYLPVSRVPCVIRYPSAFPEPTTVEHLTQGSDLAPTIFELVDIPIPPPIMGSSMAGLPAGGAPIHSHVFSVNESYPISRMVFDGRYAFVHNPGDINELYDLDTDPGQESSVLTAPEYSDVLRDMQAVLTAWRDAGCNP